MASAFENTEKNKVRKPRQKLVKIGPAFRSDGAWRQIFGDSKGRVFCRSRRRGWTEKWFYHFTIHARELKEQG